MLAWRGAARTEGIHLLAWHVRRGPFSVGRPWGLGGTGTVGSKGRLLLPVALRLLGVCPTTTGPSNPRARREREKKKRPHARNNQQQNDSLGGRLPSGRGKALKRICFGGEEIMGAAASSAQKKPRGPGHCSTEFQPRYRKLLPDVLILRIPSGWLKGIRGGRMAGFPAATAGGTCGFGGEGK